MVVKLKGNGGCVERKNLRLFLFRRRSLAMSSIWLEIKVMSEFCIC